MLLEKAEKILALHKVDLARAHRLSGQLVRLAAHSGTQTQNLSWLRDLQDQRLALDEQNCSLGIGGGILDGFERLQCIWWQIAKDMLCPHLAGQAAFYNVQTVRCQHEDPLVTYRYISAFSSVPLSTASLRGHNKFLPPSRSRARREEVGTLVNTKRRDQPPSRSTGLQTLHGHWDVVESRDDRLERLYLRRSINYLRQSLQHFWIGIGVVIVCIGLVLPQTDRNCTHAVVAAQGDFVLEALLLAQQRKNLVLKRAGVLRLRVGFQAKRDITCVHIQPPKGCVA